MVRQISGVAGSVGFLVVCQDLSNPCDSLPPPSFSELHGAENCGTSHSSFCYLWYMIVYRRKIVSDLDICAPLAALSKQLRPPLRSEASFKKEERCFCILLRRSPISPLTFLPSAEYKHPATVAPSTCDSHDKTRMPLFGPFISALIASQRLILVPSPAAMPMTPSRGRAWDPYTPLTPAREAGWNDEPPSYHSGPSTFGSATASYAPYSPIDSPAPNPSNGNVRYLLFSRKELPFMRRFSVH